MRDFATNVEGIRNLMEVAVEWGRTGCNISSVATIALQPMEWRTNPLDCARMRV